MVQEALASVIAQTWQNTEIIVVDDGSKDETFELLQARQTKTHQISVRIIKQDNNGVASARNVGLLSSRGEFLYMLDSDDLIFPGALKTLVDLIRTRNAPYALANIHCADARGRILDGQKAGISKLSKDDFYSNSWMIHAALYRRSTLVRSGLFNKSLIVGEDTEFRRRVLYKSGMGAATTTYIGVRRQHHFGHLSYNRTDLQVLQHSLQSQLAFIDWLKCRNLQIPKINTRQSISIFTTVVRLGNAGDWKSKDEAMTLYKLMAGKPAGKLAILSTLGGPNWRMYYSVLFGMYFGLRGVRNIFRFVGNLRFAVGPRLVRRNASDAKSVVR